MINNSALYLRQESLPLDTDKSVSVIGVGGIGHWVAVALALSGVRKLVLADPDSVEEHNRNRTLYAEYHIGTNKAEAMKDILADLRPDVEVIAYPKRTDNLTTLEEAEFVASDFIVDARDSFTPLGIDIPPDKPVIILRYDGDEVSFITQRGGQSAIWGEGSGYNVIPSWLVPPMILGGIAAYVILKEGAFAEIEEHGFGAVTMSLGDLSHPLTHMSLDLSGMDLSNVGTGRAK